MASPVTNWPAHLDALLSAPEHHRFLLENSSVRVLETRIEPGEVVPLHTHEWPAAYYILSAGDFIRRDASGTVVADSRVRPDVLKAGSAVWSPPLEPHTLENVGATPIHVISVEIKSPGSVDHPK